MFLLLVIAFHLHSLLEDLFGCKNSIRFYFKDSAFAFIFT